jgi:hypothetical protein
VSTGRHGATARGRHEAHAVRRARAARLALVSAGLFVTVAVLSPMTGPADASATVSPAAVSSAFTKTITETRTHIDPTTGADVPIDTRTVTVAVNVTTGLRDRQAISVSWSGAHPTGGRVPDSNSSLAAQQEYPVMMVQCRGVDSTSVPAAKRVDPSTCWTSDPSERADASPTFLWPPYRIDRYADPAQRVGKVGVPATTPIDCQNVIGGAQHWIPFNAADGTVYAGGPNGCAGIAPEAGGGTDLTPSNTTYGFTQPDGTGSSKFIVNAAESNGSMGCSDKTPCTLEIIPIMGISCDVAAATLPKADQPPKFSRPQAQKGCEDNGFYQPGEDAGGSRDVESFTVSGRLWWSESNWRNRIAVPLTLAPPANVCDLLSSAKPVFMYGAQAMAQATVQWAPAFCTNPKLFKFQHVQFSEPGSRNLLNSSSIDAAFVGGPPSTPYDKPVVQAPVAISGFAIAFQLDNALKREFVSVNLTPRLLAKLMTMSYPSGTNMRADYKALSGNPLDMVADPEFRALNVGAMEYTNGYSIAPASTLFAMSSDSDVMQALTAYINADPDARAWLDGAADPWGMVVNPNYKGIALPTASWPILDQFVSKAAQETNPCLAANPVPYLPLVAAPVSNPAIVTLNMQYGIANSQINCVNAGQTNQKLGGLGRLTPGKRAIFGVVSLADAARYQLPTASLLTHKDAGAPDDIQDTSGRTFVAPSNDSMKAAAAMLKQDKAAGTWVLPYADLRGDSGKGAYPGTMLMSLNVPTKGLLTTDAKKYADFVRFAATTGQTQGVGNGQLPEGYLPMTVANGLGSLATYAKNAADAIAAQQGYVPAVDGSSKPPAPTPIPTPTPTPIASTGSPSGGSGSSAEPSTSTSASPSVSPSASPSVTAVALVPTGFTAPINAGPLGKALPGLLGLALLTGLGAIVTLAWGRT